MKSLQEWAPIASVLLIVDLVAAGAAAATFIPVANGIRADFRTQSAEARASVDRIAQRAYEGVCNCFRGATKTLQVV